jgi:hypothetical protein
MSNPKIYTMWNYLPDLIPSLPFYHTYLLYDPDFDGDNNPATYENSGGEHWHGASKFAN